MQRSAFVRSVGISFVLANLTTAAANVSGPSVTRTDDFEDGTLSPLLWTVVDAPGGVSLLESSGVMNATAPVVGAYAQAELQSTMPLAGDFDVQVDYQWISSCGSSRTRSQLHVRDTASGSSFHVNHWRGGGSPLCGDMIWSSSASGYIGNLWSPPSAGKVRICRTGSTFTAYYWSGGWVSLGSRAGFTTPAVAVLNANSNGGSALDVQWDNWRATRQRSIRSEPVETSSSRALGLREGSWGSVKALYR